MFPRNEDGEVDVKRGVYDTKNQPKRASFKYKQEGRFCLGVVKVDSQDGKIIGKRCLVFDYTEKKIITIDAYKKEMRNELERIGDITSYLSQWVEKIKSDKIWLCESVGKIKGIGKQGEVKMNDINVHTIADFQRYVQSYGLPKLSIRGLGQIYKHALVALPRKPTPSVKDHRKARNPYYSRYGERWVDRLKTSSSMSKFCCITDLIRL